jgi:hypothetical protein
MQGRVQISARAEMLWDRRAIQAAKELRVSGEIGGEHSSGAEARVGFIGFIRGLKPPPPSESSFSAACFAPAGIFDL